MYRTFASWFESNQGCGNGIYEGNTTKEQIKEMFFEGEMSKYSIVKTTAIPSKSYIGLRLQIILTNSEKFCVVTVESSKETGAIPFKVSEGEVDSMFKNNCHCFDTLEEAVEFAVK